MTSLQLSQQKIGDLKKELKSLQQTLEQIYAEGLERGGAMDSWHESASHEPTERAFEKRVRELTNIIQSAKVLPDHVKSEKAILGSWIKLKVKDSNKILKYRLVHPLESNPRNNLVSIESPLGKLIHGQKAGFQFEFRQKQFSIVEIF